MTISDKDLAVLLERSSVFIESVHRYIAPLAPYPDQRSRIAFQAGLLAIEHATGTCTLIRIGLAPSAIALMRPQFESLVRGIWVVHAASDAWVSKLGEPLTAVSAKHANEGPMLTEMLKGLSASQSAPKEIVEQLKEYRDVTWKALNSYVHGGLHPIARTASGYPARLTYDVVRNSNAITAITFQLLSILTGDPAAMEPVRALHREFCDCLPIIGAPGFRPAGLP